MVEKSLLKEAVMDVLLKKGPTAIWDLFPIIGVRQLGLEENKELIEAVEELLQEQKVQVCSIQFVRFEDKFDWFDVVVKTT